MASRFCPFTPGTGHVPPLLAGRDTETALLVEALDRLQGPRVGAGKALAGEPLPPIRICGPRGVGKTALLNWVERQAGERGILEDGFVRVKQGPEGAECLQVEATSMAFGLANDRPKLYRKINASGSAFEKDVKQGRLIFDALLRAIVAKEPLLLTMDEVHHYDIAPLQELLRTCSKIIAEGFPLAVVMAATPGLDRHLHRADPEFLGRSEGLYINLLSDEAARDAMRVPLEQEGFAVRPDALEAMAAQADRYPYFTQLMGRAVWQAAAEAGAQEIGVDLVAQVADKVKQRQKSLHSDSYHMLLDKDLLRHAAAVVKLLESKGGVASIAAVRKTLAKSSAKHGGDPAQILDGLQLDGLVWTLDGETRIGRPSFHDYFKAKVSRH